ESMKYWGVSNDDANAYLTQPSVAYATAPGDYKEKIGTQKWLGLFDRGVEAWAEWRRLDYPVLNIPSGMTYADIPVRMPYPYNENKMNKSNYEAASTAIGGDEATTKLFWDKF
ncbi:MAG TPA: SusD/RagB family nutrient-binding outer membrane lipoprotein, partial [Bacteroidales bacterium]|nr:SusD/RagB family nutrient-binding outer membrane lipoprotein [Bacteroidales bacterium]